MDFIRKLTAILNFIKKLIKTSEQPTQVARVSAPATGIEKKIYTRSEHSVSRAHISKNALKVLYKLQDAGYEAYLVGGCVRDLLLGREPKDFDVATSAEPDQVKAVFRNCRLIGRRFRLAHVYFGRELIEVATFRSSGESSDGERVLKDGQLLRDNLYGTLEEDVIRRDFTVNALYYTVKDFSVVDYVQGMEDHKAGLLRMIGDPDKRYREDPVRMLRAVRFAVKLGFDIEDESAELIPKLSPLLADIPSARLYDELLKLFLSGYSLQAFEQLRHYRLFEQLFPETDKSLAVEEEGFPHVFLARALENTDKRIADGKPVTPYFLMAALLWEPLRQRIAQKTASGLPDYPAYQEAASELLSLQVKRLAIPKRVSIPMREVWIMQTRFRFQQGARPFRHLSHPRFRAAYDFLLLRTECGEIEPSVAEWWTKFQFADEATQKKMTQGRRKQPRKRKVKTT
ncbi:MAG: polynucleotide adenylyltransferase PcnB [Gammaproteobacteria bacterium]|nr:MAG: polynucleotide adenylyltransferase PcnB [Gammaproteobacteria bacterium]